PLSVPILAVVFILSFIAAITEVPVASLLLRDVNSYTLAVGMQQYLNPQNYLWGDFAAAAVMSALPITIVFLLAQRWLVNGLTAGGVKGYRCCSANVMPLHPQLTLSQLVTVIRRSTERLFFFRLQSESFAG